MASTSTFITFNTLSGRLASNIKGKKGSEYTNKKKQISAHSVKKEEKISKITMSTVSGSELNQM